jgi:hypothetical protein
VIKTKNLRKIWKNKKYLAVVGIFVIAVSVYAVQFGAKKEYRPIIINSICHPEYGSFDLTEEENEKMNDIYWRHLKKINSLVLEYTPADAELEVDIFFKPKAKNSEKVELIESNGKILEFSGGATALAIIKAGNIDKIRKSNIIGYIDLSHHQEKNFKYIPPEIMKKVREEHKKETESCIEEIIKAHEGEEE